MSNSLRDATLTIETTQEGLVLVIILVGRLNSATSSRLEKRARQLILAAESKRFIFDCEQLRYISSAGLRVFLSSAKLVNNSKGRLILCNFVPSVREVFEISGFMSILDVCGSRDEALAALA